MPFRFRRSIRIVQGVRLGLSRRGVSASATLPGTGISYTVTTPHGLVCSAITAGVAWWVGWL